MEQSGRRKLFPPEKQESAEKSVYHYKEGLQFEENRAPLKKWGGYDRAQND